MLVLVALSSPLAYCQLLLEAREFTYWIRHTRPTSQVHFRATVLEAGNAVICVIFGWIGGCATFPESMIEVFW